MIELNQAKYLRDLRSLESQGITEEVFLDLFQDFFSLVNNAGEEVMDFVDL
jgi:hypothetical protein